MALLGYARVSTRKQKLDAQLTLLKSEGIREDRIFTDVQSGSTDDREGLKKLLIRAESGDTILCAKMDRLGRNTADMVNIVDDCYKKGIAIRFLENGLSTEGTMGKMIIQILAAVAEAERARILERTNEGRESAMEAGVQFGRKPFEHKQRVIELIKQNVDYKDIMQETGVSKSTFFRIRKTVEWDLKT
jgi:DNA invertase Pin-like site-specific DNA recombinase